MKSILVFNCLCLFLLSTLCTSAQSADPVKKANKSNEKKVAGEMINKEVADFLVESADARMMDKIEGAMAAKRGTTKAVRQYGQLMVKDQTMLLDKIKQLAMKRNITLPVKIGDKKESGRGDLADKNGKDFDKKFVKMMRIDHERDIKMFEKASSSDDKAVSVFASENLPMIQSHLDKIKMLEETMKK